MLIDTENNYQINIIENDFSRLLEELEGFKGNKIALISDENLYRLYGDFLDDIFEDFDICEFIIRPGEPSKSLKTYKELMEFLSTNYLDRSSLILAFGGGVVGDLAGFAASTYQRGIPLISVPTSLLAMVDSSVGGKTAINLAGLKNQIGSFYFPSYVHIDPSFLISLDEENIKSGLGEIIKYGLLYDEKIFSMLEDSNSLDMNELIERSVRTKIHFVSGDEFDQGKRQFLNLGHSLGHGIESISNYQIAHGQAVGIGLYLISKISEGLGLAEDGLSSRIKGLLDKYSMPSNYDFSKDQIIGAIKHDKKIRSDKISLVLPIDIAKACIKKVSFDELYAWLDFL